MSNRPKPTALKLLQGNAGKRPLNKREPKPRLGAEAPACMSPRALTAWASIAPMLTKLKLLTEADGPALAMLCESYADWQEFTEVIGKEGRTFVFDGVSMVHPLVKKRDAALKLVKSMLVEFGMTPAARSKVSVAPEGDGGTKDPWQSLKPAAM